MFPQNTCPGSFRRTSNCVSKENEIRKCNFTSYKIFSKQYFGLNFGRLKMKQVPKSREYDVRKRLNFARFLGTSLNKRYGGGGGGGRVDYVPLKIVNWDTLPP